MDNPSQPSQLSAQLAYQTVFQLSDDAIVVLNPDYTILYMNPTAETVLKVSQANASGQTLTTLLLTQHKVKFSPLSLPTEPIALKLNDETRYYAITQKLIPNNLGYIVTLKDVTIQHNALLKVEHLQTQYSDFAHTVGHDVKSPLNVAIGYSNMLQSEFEEGTDHRLYIDEIFETSMRMMYICNELVMLGELGHLQTVETAPVDLKLVLDTVLRRYEKDIAERNLTVKIPDRLPFVVGNHPWLEEVLVDYLGYAILKTGSPTMIEFGIDRQDKMVHIWIKHDGQPLSATQQTAIFEGDLNLENIRAEGHGLGLGIAKHVIELLGGEVGFKNSHTMYFTLPAGER